MLLFYILILYQTLIVTCFDPLSSQARIRVQNGNIIFEAPPRKNITFKSNLGTIYVNGDNLASLVSIVKNSANGLSTVNNNADDISSDLSTNQRFNSIKNTVDKLNEFSETLTKAKSLFSETAQGSLEPRDYRRTVFRVNKISKSLERLKKRLEDNLCRSNPCRNGGSCLSGYRSFLCLCRSGWEGITCESDVDECSRYAGSDLGCQNGATCRNLPGSYQCDCPNGFFGVHCVQRSDDCASASNEELCGHGVCMSLAKPAAGRPHFTCICDQGWTTDGTSPACRVDVDECSGPYSHCSVNPPVECINYPGGFTCGPCPAGYRKHNYHCIDIDECQVNNGGCSFSPRVQCTNIPGGRECGPCPPGFIGDGITCTFSGICSQKNGGCSPIASCTENPAIGGAGRECRCPVGYVGNGEGPDGCLPITGVSCEQNPCVHGTCQSLQVASSTASNFICQCEPGFTGVRCDVPVNYCSPNPCLNGGNCVNEVSGVLCICPSTFQGDRCQFERESCGGEFDQPFGVISYPSNGMTYPALARCSWRIRTSAGKAIRLVFTEFEIEPSLNCDADYLSIHDGPASSYPLLAKLCGSIDEIPNNRTVLSEQPFIFINFKSDGSDHRIGFSLNWTTEVPECGGMINETNYGTIFSPGYPNRYPPSRDCYWYIYGPLGKRIVFHFALLALENHPNCRFDFLRIYDGTSDSDPLLGNFCNTSLPAPITTSGPYALLHFHSDRNKDDAGFHITFSTITGIPGCGGLLTGDRGMIMSPAFPNKYDQNLDCDWLIRVRSPNDRIEIKFQAFHLEHHPNCRYDYLEIRDGADPTAPLIGRYCSEQIKPPGSIISTSNKLFIHFKSDWSREGPGFKAIYEVHCGGFYNAESGVLTSPNYPLPYPNDKECVYSIRVPAGKVIQLAFTDFELEDSPGCRYDYVILTEPGLENSNLTGPLCGSYIPDMITSTLNELMITFKTDAHSQFTGFRANYSTLDASCGGVLRDKHGIFTSPNHPDNYADGRECVWILNAPPGFIVQLTFTLFILEVGPRCQFDHVEVIEGNVTLGRFCGQQLPPSLISSGEQLIVRFKSDASISHEGFVASYSFLDGSKFCGGTRRASSGEITSPNFPKNYPARRRCLWKIIAPEGNQIRLEFKEFSIEFADKCSFDFVEIRNGLDEMSPIIGRRFCGDELPPPITTHAHVVSILFKTDSGISKRGFRLAYETMATGCGGLLRAHTGLIVSPNYPYPYSHNAECTWIIKTSKGSRVSAMLVDIEFESHTDCGLDRVDLFDGSDDRSPRLARICGDALIPGTITSKGDTMTIKMVTDSSLSFRGFKLNYWTNCSNSISGFRGAIESPNYPDNYPTNINCSWTINVPKGNNISLAFQEFNLGDSCTNNYLELVEPEVKRRFCGSNITLGNIMTNDNSIEVNFVSSNIRSSGPGFRLEWRTVGCGGELLRDSGRITSPNYPNSYSHAVECLWHVKVSPGFQITAKIIEYDIELNKDCRFDALQIYAGPDTTSPRLAELCGNSKLKTITINGNYMTVFFRADATVAGKGFRIDYNAKPGVCGGVYDLEEGSVVSPNYPGEYDSSDDCIWTIIYDSHRLQLTIANLDIPSSVNCSESYLAIYDGRSYSDPVIGQFCGKSPPASAIISSSDTVSIRFKSDGRRTGKGFMLNYRAICGGKRPAFAWPDILHNPGYPGLSIKNPSCSWIITAPNPGDRIRWSFTFLTLPEPHYSPVNLNVRKDDAYIELREGDSPDSPLIARYTESRIPEPVITQGNSLYIQKLGAVIFSASYSMDISRCGGPLNGLSGFFTSPGYPDNYPLSSNCVWYIDVSPGNRISLTFTDFNLEFDEFCSLDYVEIRETNYEGSLIGRYCGDTIPVFSNQTVFGSLWIKFQTNGEGTSRGFQASFDTIPHVDLTDDKGQLSSPGYPKYILRDKPQSWTIIVSDEMIISFNFIVIEITQTDDALACTRSVQIFDGPNADSPELGRFCGHQVKERVRTSSNVAHVLFKPFFGSRLLLAWKAEAKNMTSPLTFDTESKKSLCTQQVPLALGSNVTITSPGYPFGYSNGMNCSWLLRSPMGTHPFIEIEDLNIEPGHETCSYDKVNFYGYDFDQDSWKFNRSLCGKVKDRFDLIFDLARIDFITDLHINKTGFNMTIHPRCGGTFRKTRGEINSTLLGSSENCEWTIVVREGHTISISFASFNLGQADDLCTKGYLVIKNGLGKSSPLVGKYCGSNKPPNFESISNAVYIEIKAPFGVQTEFKLVYREVSVGCGQTIDLDEVTPATLIQSPNYPSPPPHGLECEWLIRGPVHRNLRIDFEISPEVGRCNLNRTHVDVFDGGTGISPRLKRYCPRPRSSGVTTSENMMFIRYMASGDLSLASFQATVQINICGGTYFVRNVAFLTSPNYPKPYENNMNCGYYVHASQTSQVISIYISSMELPSNSLSDCSSGDYLEFRENGPTGDLIKRVCGTRNSTLSFHSATNIVYMLFKSDSEFTGKGFNVRFRPYYDSCYQFLDASDSGIISSPRFPLSHPGSRVCHWSLQAPADRRITLTFTDYNLKPNLRVANSCLDQINIIYGSQNTDFTNDLAFDGTKTMLPCGTRSSFSVSSPYSLMILEFKTSGLSPGEGFKASYSANDPTECGGIVTKDKPEMISTNFSSPTDGSIIYCLWKIEIDGSDHSQTKWIEYETLEVLGSDESDEACSQGGVKEGFFSGYNMMNNRIFCGNRSNYISIAYPHQSNIAVEAKINRTNGYRGLKATYHVSDCGGIVSAIPGRANISSPGWPANYPVNYTCLWELPGWYGASWTINFTDFELEPDCSKDYVEIREGNLLDSALVGRYCGPNKPPPFSSIGHEALVIFRSNGDGTSKGFSFTIENEMKSCGGRFTGDYIFLKSYPKSYPKDYECVWIVEVDPTYRLNLTFVSRFDIETSVNCTKDYVSIEEWSPTKEWINLERYCGLVPPPSRLLSTNKARVVFHSDSDDRRGDGFYLVVEKKCGSNFIGPGSGIIQSPGFPRYHHKSNCEWTIKGDSPSDYVILNFEKFDIEPGRVSCSYDYVKIIRNNSTDSTLGPYCGSDSPGKIVSRGQVQIVFRSDSSFNRRGFSLKYQVIPCGGNFTGTSGTIASPNIDGIYAPNAYCSYLITVPSDMVVRLRFTRFELYITELCTRSAPPELFQTYPHSELDYLEIRDGPTPLSPLIRRLCGYMDPITVKSTENSLLLLFHSDDSLQARGFTAVWEATLGIKQGCGGLMMTNQGTIQSPDADNDGRYDKNLDCSWELVGDGGNSVIEITFTLMDITPTSESPKIECNDDYLEIHDGLSKESPLIDVYCSSELPSKLTTSTNRALIKFHSGESGSGAGFRLTYKTVNISCGGQIEVTNVTQTLTSPGYPSPYSASVSTRCRWQFVTEYPFTSIRLNFTDIDIDCSAKDSLEVIGNSVAPDGHRFCGSNRPPYIQSIESLTLILSSGPGGGKTSRGFSLDYKITDCNDTHTDGSGVILSPRYPYFYTYGTSCSFSILAPEGYTISVYFQEFELSSIESSCTHMRMTVQDGPSSKGKSIANLCGDKLPDPIFSSGNILSFYIHGVFFKYALVYTTTNAGPGCGGDIKAINGTFTSPAHPKPYSKDSECTWNVYSFGYHSLTFRFMTFDLTSEPGCDTNYVELYDGALIARYCGSEIPAQYVTKGNTLTVKMVTSANNTGTGFRAIFTTNKLGLGNPNQIITKPRALEINYLDGKPLNPLLPVAIG